MKRTAILLFIIICAVAAGCSPVEPPESGLAAPSSTVSATPSPTTLPAPSPTPLFLIELTELPEEYHPKEAAANGDYVNVHGKEFYNEGKLTAFLSAVSAKKDAAIRVVGYSDEGDPSISDVIYDGSKFTVWYDNTRDQYGIRETVEYEFKNILEYELEDGRILIILTNESEITKDMLENGYDGFILTVRRNNPSLGSG